MVGIAVVTIIARKKTQTRQGLWGLLHYCMQDKKTMYNGRKRGSAAEYQADERVGVAGLSWRVSGR